ncbi:Septum formation initiator [Xylanimonas cellulosilytica DSM 15894]|uniref:Septum formation initiator n=1 Tax=Xylanimonas cellulosilytica (strain DSM 15894 / JCM 12276 / CECT 5975 / KCTC 9989 / LMG 20990 / NBRC 107835 / XIL07) TaxID=446471 RepID=D1BXQ4_XYLCX|nr:septum formation initiator family protein [Xylanimonas cellulosilytica]ACZ31695.1 Septum formation initiator [Xylanimonas cellulosilytica DSM 15894]
MRAILNRPGGPARGDRRRAHNGLVLPEVVTVRLLVLSVVVLIAAVLLVPTVRAAVQQSMELHQLRGELEARQAQADGLQRELERWEDGAFIERQARERLLYVMPGDNVWRTIGGEDVVEDIDPATGKQVEAGVVGGHGGAGTPWYATLWDSVQVADGPRTPDAVPAETGDDAETAGEPGESGEDGEDGGDGAKGDDGDRAGG